MSTSQNNLAEESVDPPVEETVEVVRPSRSVSELLAELELSLTANPENWKLAVLETLGQWPESSEEYAGKTFAYLIGGEAFDWRLLATRILETVENGPEPEVWQAWLDTPDLFAGFGEPEFMRVLGVDKSRGSLSFFYGVTVEQGLIVAAREEIAKRRVASGRAPSDDHCDDVYRRLYGNDCEGLWDEFCAATGLAETTGASLNPPEISLGQDDSFMYWLFKRRMEQSDPARVASDTRKGLAQLEKMLRSHERRGKMLRDMQRV
jgi:hypothetical protein